eukprot:CAMPEP_0113880192 /NCGR_PEP_ID=MMETSP0780_2-20120614/7650_1 /TAXON_ID=652834 /ORGANISM="Palpitomonas bilix" /LENGTH=665 /DNA_ID=CAMNT_0000866843 /DNA_START=566 /DNA_END=2563 /DNA_ORIENTATION=- /assembly_acc=CAM_ASM_000599
MSFRLQQALKEEKCEFVVAPYEADAQLAALFLTGRVSAIITEDSDLLVHGAGNVFFKMDKDGLGVLLSKSDIFGRSSGSTAGLSGALSNIRSFSDDDFMHMCILMGCDYLPGINGVGGATACKMVSECRSIEKIFHRLRFDSKWSMPKGYETEFKKARLVFRHQTVFDLAERKQRPLHPLRDEDKDLIHSLFEAEEKGDVVNEKVTLVEDNQGGGEGERDKESGNKESKSAGPFDFLGALRDDDVAKLLSEGHVNPRTLEPFNEMEERKKWEGDTTSSTSFLFSLERDLGKRDGGEGGVAKKKKRISAVEFAAVKRGPLDSFFGGRKTQVKSADKMGGGEDGKKQDVGTSEKRKTTSDNFSSFLSEYKKRRKARDEASAALITPMKSAKTEGDEESGHLSRTSSMEAQHKKVNGGSNEGDKTAVALFQSNDEEVEAREDEVEEGGTVLSKFFKVPTLTPAKSPMPSSILPSQSETSQSSIGEDFCTSAPLPSTHSVHDNGDEEVRESEVKEGAAFVPSPIKFDYTVSSCPPESEFQSSSPPLPHKESEETINDGEEGEPERDRGEVEDADESINDGGGSGGGVGRCTPRPAFSKSSLLFEKFKYGANTEAKGRKRNVGLARPGKRDFSSPFFGQSLKESKTIKQVQPTNLSRFRFVKRGGGSEQV